MSDFSDLLQEAEKINCDLEGVGGLKELPTVDRSIRQVLEASNDLYSKIAQSGSKDIQANLLLGSKGVDLPKIIQKLETISTKRVVEATETDNNVNLESFLENEFNNCVLGIFDEVNNKTSDLVRQEIWQHQEDEWKTEKRSFLNSMVSSDGSFIELEKNTSVIMEPPVYLSHALTVAEALYAQKVIEYNNLLQNSKQQNIISSFETVATELLDAKVKDMWDMIVYMSDLPPFRGNASIETRNTPEYTNCIVNQGRKYLENRYKTFMNSVVNENLQIAMLGGIPGTYPLVRSFVRVRFQGEYSGLKDDKIDDRPLWPMVYYSIRCGDLKAAIYCLKKKSDKEFEDIVLILEAKDNNAEESVIKKHEETIKYNYKRIVRNETDPFKRIVYSVLGCCDITDEHAEVARTADDYLWLKLCLVRTNHSEGDHINFNELQRTILEEYGESHYDAFNQPHLYFQVLILSGQFEAALEFLSRIERYKVHAVHMAIGLNELYMLSGPKQFDAPLLSIDTSDVKPSRRLNLARLVMIYVKKFELNCINEALHYFYLLRNLKNDEGVGLFEICVCDLAVETKEFAKIFGCVKSSKIKTIGLINQFKNYSVSTEDIAQLVGNVLVKKGLFEDAIEVFSIADNQEEVFSLCSTLLSQVVEFSSNEDSLKKRLVCKAEMFIDRYQQEGLKVSSNLIMSFNKLKQIAYFFDLYHDKKYSLALSVLDDLELIPKYDHELKKRINLFKKLSVDVCKTVPDVLLATMTMIYDEYQKIKSNKSMVTDIQMKTMDTHLKGLREYAKILISYTGMLPYRMPGDTNSKLIQLEILMH